MKNSERTSILGSLNEATINYRGICSEKSLQLLNIIADIADQCIPKAVRRAATTRFLEILCRDYDIRPNDYDIKETTVYIDLVKLAKYLNTTTTQVKDWLSECCKVERAVYKHTYTTITPMILCTDILTNKDGTRCTARIIISALLLLLYRCKNSSYALDFLAYPITDNE